MYRSNCAVALLGLIGVLFACNARSAQNSAADPQPAKPAHLQWAMPRRLTRSKRLRRFNRAAKNVSSNDVRSRINR